MLCPLLGVVGLLQNIKLVIFCDGLFEVSGYDAPLAVGASHPDGLGCGLTYVYISELRISFTMMDVWFMELGHLPDVAECICISRRYPLSVEWVNER